MFLCVICDSGSFFGIQRRKKHTVSHKFTIDLLNKAKKEQQQKLTCSTKLDFRVRFFVLFFVLFFENKKKHITETQLLKISSLKSNLVHFCCCCCYCCRFCLLMLLLFEITKLNHQQKYTLI